MLDISSYRDMLELNRTTYNRVLNGLRVPTPDPYELWGRACGFTGWGVSSEGKVHGSWVMLDGVGACSSADGWEESYMEVNIQAIHDIHDSRAYLSSLLQRGLDEFFRVNGGLKVGKEPYGRQIRERMRY